MPRVRVIATLLILGGTVFGVLGALHAIYTLLVLRNPRRLVPVDPSVAHAMANSALRLSGGRTDMWRAWIGFSFSHSLGPEESHRPRISGGAWQMSHQPALAFTRIVVREHVCRPSVPLVANAIQSPA